jgi:RNA polymerase sigma-70 factor (ECF subfamily)
MSGYEGGRQVEEAELVNRAREGSDAAWHSLVYAHQEAIFRLTYLLLGDRDEAEDVAQDTFIRAFHALGTFDETRPLRPWLLAIATNLVRNRRRSCGALLAAMRRAIQAEPPPVTTLGERTGQEWEAQTLWQAVRRLRAAEQEVVYMRYFLEMSEADMASALQVAPGTVKSRLHRALARLRTW